MAQPTVSRLKHRTLAMKPETAYATDVFGGTVTAADIIPVFNLQVAPRREMFRNEALSGLGGALPAVPGAELVEVRFSMWARGRGSAYSGSNKPEAGLPLRGSLLLETVDTTPSNEKVTYSRRASGFESMTLYAMSENAPTVEVVGAFGNMELVLVNGQPFLMNFTFLGLLDAYSTVAVVTSVPPATPIHPQWKSAALQIGTENYAARLQNFRMNMNNVLDPIEAPNSIQAFAGINPVPAAITGDMDPEADVAATFDWLTKWRDGTLLDLTFGSNGAQYARQKFAATKLQIQEKSWGGRGEKQTFPIGFLLAMDAGIDEFTLTFD